MVLTLDRRVRLLVITEAELMDVILYSGTLPAGIRAADCYRDIDTTAGAFQEEEIAGAIRVGQSKVDTLWGAPSRSQ